MMCVCHFELEDKMFAFGGVDSIWLRVKCSSRCFENGNHPSDYIRIRNVFDDMNKCRFHNNNSALSLSLFYLFYVGNRNPRITCELYVFYMSILYTLLGV
jgi:hypothetical protein